MNFKFFSKNGKILPFEQAVIPITNLEYAYGFGVYETLRVEKKYAFFLQDHLERLLKSAEIIKLAHPFNIIQLTRDIQDLIYKLENETYNLKILLIGGKKLEDVLLFIFPSAPFFPDKKLSRDGIYVNTYEYERLYPNAKTLNMLPSYLAYSKAKNDGYYDTLFVDNNGNILEGTMTNFFVIKEKILYTPPTEKILEGVTRKMVIQVAKDNGYKVIEHDIRLDRISDYDGAFLTSTSTKILPIKKLGEFEYPQISLEIVNLRELFDTYLDSLLPV